MIKITSFIVITGWELELHVPVSKVSFQHLLEPPATFVS